MGIITMFLLHFVKKKKTMFHLHNMSFINLCYEKIIILSADKLKYVEFINNCYIP